MIDEDQEIGNELDHGECQVGSVISAEILENMESDTHISDASDADSLEFTAIKLFYCSLEIRSSLEFNEASDRVSKEAQNEGLEILTPCHHGRDRSRSRQRRGWIDGRSLSGPISRIHVSRCPGMLFCKCQGGSVAIQIVAYTTVLRKVRPMVEAPSYAK